MRRSLILLLAVAALAAPSAALAADPVAANTTTAVSNAVYVEITGITLDGQTLKVGGKGYFESGKVSFSVGCNSIGGDATLDGDQLTIGQLMQTEMACAEPMASAEAALLKFLAGGVITVAADAWTNAAGSMSVVTSVVDPAPVPAPSGDPDGTVVSPPDLGFSLDDCVGILPADEFPSMGGGSGSSGSGSGSTTGGSGGASTGSGTVDPVEPPPPAPDATTAIDPGFDGGSAPAATAGDVPPVPAETAIDLPLPVESAIAVDPGVVVEKPTPVPGSGTVTPTLEQCRDLVAKIRTLGPVAPNVDTTGGSGVTAAEGAYDKSASTGTPVLPFAVVVLTLGAVALVLYRRSRPTAEADVD